jgi:hypothetical protein
MTTRTIHHSVTLDRIIPLAEAQMFGLENPGVCIACGEDRDGCEPDARGYECYACGERAVYGAEELLIILA